MQTKAIKNLIHFISKQQMTTIVDACEGEEKQFFFDKLIEYSNRINNMPKTYEQDGQGNNAIAYLHYFKGNMDWYITEKDSGGEEQIQAFGLANLGYGGELGYISIKELIEANVELDLHFTPTPLTALRV